MREFRRGVFDTARAKGVLAPTKTRVLIDSEAQKRLDAELDQRFEALLPEEKSADRPLSRVEQVMRRNAPDLAGGSEEEIAAARARRRAHHYATAPRPRIAALVVLLWAGVLQPALVLRFALWGVVLFLVVSVAIGPERARDYSKAIWLRFVWLWKHEIVLARKGFAALRAWLALRGRGAF